MAERVVKVRRKNRVIQVYQKSKTVWIASGEDIQGEVFEIQGHSENSAADLWRDAAEYHNK